jgi:PLP dependent protein
LIEAERVASGLARVRERIEAAGGDPDRITIVAVTKTFGPDAIRVALECGISDIGENYAAELLDKAAAAPEGVRWHFLGTIQRRKVRDLAPVVRLWQGLSRPVEAEAIARHAPGASVLVEVDTTGIPGRSGVPPESVPALVAAARAAGLEVAGLMTIAGPGGGEAALGAFRAVAGLCDDLELTVRSMGMTGDLEQAVLAGTTMVRIGEALFGPRPRRSELAQ